MTIYLQFIKPGLKYPMFSIVLCLTAYFPSSCLFASILLSSEQDSQENAILQSDQYTILGEQLRIKHKAVLDEMNKIGPDGNPAQLDDPKMPALLKRGWELAGKWAAAYFETHPRPSDDELNSIFEEFAEKPKGEKSKYGDFFEYHEYVINGRAVKVGSDIYVVTSSYALNFPETATFIIVARDHEGRFQSLWNIKDLAEEHYASRDEIGRWAHLTRRAYYNGPLTVNKILPIQPALNGHARFLIDAYQSADGGTALAQLSIWEWDGSEAKLLFIDTYNFAIDSGEFELTGNKLTIDTKEDLRTVYSCGMCPEPRATWTVLILPDQIRDMGRVFKQPELKWADELFSKILDREDTVSIATPKVAKAIKVRMEEIGREYSKVSQSKKYELSTFGMLEKCRIIHRDKTGGEFDLSMDEAEMRFKYSFRKGKPFFTSLRIQ